MFQSFFLKYGIVFGLHLPSHMSIHDFLLWQYDTKPLPMSPQAKVPKASQKLLSLRCSSKHLFIPLYNINWQKLIQEIIIVIIILLILIFSRRGWSSSCMKCKILWYYITFKPSVHLHMHVPSCHFFLCFKASTKVSLIMSQQSSSKAITDIKTLFKNAWF